MEKILVIAGHFENLSNLTKRLKDLLPESTLITPLFGPEGITLDSSLDPDLILIGPEDPVIYELCRNLKRDEWLQEVPLLFLLEGPGHLAAGLKAVSSVPSGLSRPRYRRVCPASVVKLPPKTICPTGCNNVV